MVYLLAGKGLEKEYENEITQKDLEIYSEITTIANCKAKANYFKKLKTKHNNKYKFGKGLEENPISLFTELSKLLSAKKAGHNNVKDEVIKILDELIKLKYYKEKNKNKILKKYF